jgi:hypothetical protein
MYTEEEKKLGEDVSDTSSVKVDGTKISIPKQVISQ